MYILNVMSLLQINTHCHTVRFSITTEVIWCPNLTKKNNNVNKFSTERAVYITLCDYEKRLCTILFPAL